jgi:hypothetical protein
VLPRTRTESRKAAYSPSVKIPTGLASHPTTYPISGTEKRTTSARSTTYGDASTAWLASPLSRRVVVAPERSTETMRCVTRVPSAARTETIWPTRRSSAGASRAIARAPVSMAGPIEPDRNTSGRTSRASAASVTTMHRTPTTAPTVSAT